MGFSSVFMNLYSEERLSDWEMLLHLLPCLLASAQKKNDGISDADISDVSVFLKERLSVNWIPKQDDADMTFQKERQSKAWFGRFNFLCFNWKQKCKKKSTSTTAAKNIWVRLRIFRALPKKKKSFNRLFSFLPRGPKCTSQYRIPSYLINHEQFLSGLKIASVSLLSLGTRTRKKLLYTHR